MGCFLTLWLLAVSARAQSPDDKSRAAELYAQGDAEFKAARYDAAIEKFTEAYRLTSAPGFLFNIAQAHRLKGDCRAALNVYKTYLREDATAPREKVEKRIREMEQCATKQHAEEKPREPTQSEPQAVALPPTPAPPTPAPPAVAPAAKATVAQSAPRAWPKWVSIGLFATSGVAVVGGAYYLRQGASRQDEFEATCTFANPCTAQQAKAFADRGQQSNARAAVMLSAAGAALVAGTAIYFLFRNSPAVEVAVSPREATISWAGAF